MVDQAASHGVAQVEDALQDLKTVIRQSRTATAGERIPDRMVSVADPDAWPIEKGKVGQPVPLGYKVQIMEAENGWETDYSVHTGNPPNAEALGPASDRHRAQFGSDPDSVATGRGYDSAHNQKDCHDCDIGTVAISKRGKRSEARIANAEPRVSPSSACACRSEGTISRVKQKHGSGGAAIGVMMRWRRGSG